jgi:hypothetical protein
LNRWVRITTIIYRSAATWNAVSPNHNWRKGYWKGALREESQCKINLQNQIKEFEEGSVRLVLEIDATLKKVPTELEEIECLTGRQTLFAKSSLHRYWNNHANKLDEWAAPQATRSADRRCPVLLRFVDDIPVGDMMRLLPLFSKPMNR